MTTFIEQIHYDLQYSPNFPLRGKIGQQVRRRECFVGLCSFYFMFLIILRS